MSNKLELLIRKAGRDLASWQVCRIFKVPEEMQQTPCDFFGYTADGRAILIEAKMVNRISLPIGTSPGLAPHQWTALCEAARANCIALIAWQRKNYIAVLDVDIAQELSKGRRSIPWKKIPERFLHPISDSRITLTVLEPYLCVGRT